MKLSEIKNKKRSPSGNRSLVSCITNRDTHHYTNEDNTLASFLCFPQKNTIWKTEKSLISKRLKCFQVIVFISFGVCPVIKSTNTSHWNCFHTNIFSKNSATLTIKQNILFKWNFYLRANHSFWQILLEKSSQSDSGMKKEMICKLLLVPLMKTQKIKHWKWGIQK